MMTTDTQPADWKRLGLDGLAFFGRISASISHELKNFLAIFNEQAGILADMALLAERGGELHIERLKTLAGSMQAQVKRADVVLVHMNAFAHSVDTPEANVDAAGVAALVLALSRRLAVCKGVALTISEPGVSLPVRTSPFFLQNLLFLLLWRAVEGADASKSVRVSVAPGQSAVLVRFEGMTQAAVSAPADDREIGLLAMLGAELRRDPEGALILVLPEQPVASAWC
ncbi:hypothetical protein PCS_01208 [Desulfocurvibacter africanus PCS]|uniref:Histidine kinase n=1 Tax=Desulfocurvibacter africanus PCS TaxID=1262666 RepID=M5Q382_DESAF|nr:hypothetical protein [Desulfocurvibacter africanus]EMG38038.1 hypothetical protein PCS_01208 [Desulfocurvibacter africanus PCS]